MTTASKLFATAPNKAGKKVAIVILTGRSQDNPSGPARLLKKTGVYTYNIGIFPLTPAILKPLPGPTFVVKWKELPEAVTKIRIPIIRGNELNNCLKRLVSYHKCSSEGCQEHQKLNSFTSSPSLLPNPRTLSPQIIIHPTNVQFMERLAFFPS